MLTEYGKNNVVDKLLVRGVMRNYGGEKSPGKDSALRERSLGGDNSVNFLENKHRLSPHMKQSKVSPIKNEISPRR